eukprot:GHVN01077090.1.p1 GENE.GHVN01077090.1~~GHVN01077090.1.p1  ORF type:complete len:415 (+),score=91.28 GHVN01077090.1:139-1383(+)
MVDIVCPSWGTQVRFPCRPSSYDPDFIDHLEERNDQEVWRIVMKDRWRVELIEFFKHHRLPVQMAIDFIHAGIDSLDVFANQKPCTTNYVECHNKVKWLPGHRVRIEQVMARAKDNVAAYRGYTPAPHPSHLTYFPPTPTQHQSLQPLTYPPPKMQADQCYDCTSQTPKTCNCKKEVDSHDCPNPTRVSNEENCPTLARMRQQGIDTNNLKKKGKKKHIRAVPLPSTCPYGCEDCPYHPNGYQRVVVEENDEEEEEAVPSTENISKMTPLAKRAWKPSWRRRNAKNPPVPANSHSPMIVPSPSSSHSPAHPSVAPVAYHNKTWIDNHPVDAPFDFASAEPAESKRERAKVKHSKPGNRPHSPSLGTTAPGTPRSSLSGAIPVVLPPVVIPIQIQTVQSPQQVVGVPVQPIYQLL